MIWNSWSEFWAMGGKGFFVWGAYAVTFAALAIEIAWLHHRSRGKWAASPDSAASLRDDRHEAAS